jgi:phosphatidylserine/phosphatidylglycerophosphate/cardiolipin synthase-like enzyme
MPSSPSSIGLPSSLPAVTFHVTPLQHELTLGENWYELALGLEGDIVQPFISYFFQYCHPTAGPPLPLLSHDVTAQSSSSFWSRNPTLIYDLKSPALQFAFLAQDVSRCGILPFVRITSATARFRIEAIKRARRSIFIQTPNLTSRGIINALKFALLKSVEVTLYVPRNMMVWESFITGWTTTARCVKQLLRWTKRHPETQLILEWYQSEDNQPFRIDEHKSHLKFMVVDQELVILGSSNLDRASVCTSGEVDIAFSNDSLAKTLLHAVQRHQRTGHHNVV